LSLTTDSIKPNPQDENRLYLYGSRLKTTETFLVPLFPKALALIEKFGGIENLPRYTNQKTNAYFNASCTVL
jgi:hypothetical protein